MESYSATPDDALDSEVVIDHIPANRRSLRIACVTETYPPEVNGVSLTIARMVNGLHARNHEVQLVRPRQKKGQLADHSDHFNEVLLRGLPIPRYPELRMGTPSRRLLIKLWKLNRPDVVHIATEGPLGWSALQAALQLKLPVCSDFRTNFHLYTQHYGIGLLRKPILGYLRKFHNQTQVTMVPTDALKRELAADGFKRLEVVTRGVDTRQFDPSRRNPDLRAQWGAQGDALVLLYVGRLAREKNMDLMLQAYRSITSQMPSMRLVVVGSGPLEGELRAACPDAVFAGQRRGEDLAAHYASADLLLFPSLTETFGNVTTEALASGLPLVAYDYAAAAQLITHGIDGLRIPLNDERAYVNAAVALALDPARRDYMGRAARVRALQVDWDAIIDRIEVVMNTTARSGATPVWQAAVAAGAI